MDVIENETRTFKQVRRGSDTLVVIFNSWIFEPGYHEFHKLAMARRFDVIWLSDMTQLWFLGGADGIDGDADALRDWLREQAASYRRVVCIGNSAGGTASLLFGAEIGADLTFNTGPQTRMRATGGLTQMFTLNMWKQAYDDLELRCIAEPDSALARRIDIVEYVGALGDTGTRHLVIIPPSDIRDLYDAWRLRGLPGLRVFVSERDNHPGIQRLFEAGLVTVLFDLFDDPRPLAPAATRLMARFLPEYLVHEPAWRRVWRQARLSRQRRHARKLDPSGGRRPDGRRMDPRDA